MEQTKLKFAEMCNMWEVLVWNGKKIRSLGLDTSNFSCLLEIQMKRVNKQENIRFWNSDKNKEIGRNR